MDYKKMFNALIEKIGKEEIGRIIVEKICKEGIGRIVIRNTCPSLFDLLDAKECKLDLQECPGCWAKALGLEEAD